jgi:hypothetical protein
MPNEMAEIQRENNADIAKAPRALNPFGGTVAHQASNALAATDQSRAIAETQAAMVIAKRFPRNQVEAMDKILQAFTRPSLAEASQYEYSRGGSKITGPSIRAAETIAQLWGNIQFGVRELEQRNGESTVEAFAWDIETNTRQVKVFQVPHIRHTNKGAYRLEDPRDVYELVANQGARRLRACILGIIPGDVVEAAMNQADVTMETSLEITPELLKSLVERFAAFGVTKDAIEKKIQRRIDAITPALLVNLKKIYNSLKDGMSSAADWFELAPAGVDPATGEVTEHQPATKGAAGLKAAAAKAASKQAPAPAKSPTDAAGPAETSAAPVVTYAQVADDIAKATSVDALDLAADMIRSVKDVAHQDELKKQVEQARAKLTTQPLL